MDGPFALSSYRYWRGAWKKKINTQFHAISSNLAKKQAIFLEDIKQRLIDG